MILRTGGCVESSVYDSQFAVLLVGQMDVLAAPTPRPDAVLKLGERGIFGLGGDAKLIQRAC
jgi:hypothetical protein